MGGGDVCLRGRGNCWNRLESLLYLLRMRAVDNAADIMLSYMLS